MKTRAGDDEPKLTLNPATPDQQTWIDQLDIFGGLDSYNINDDTFTPSNWRTQTLMALYDGKAPTSRTD